MDAFESLIAMLLQRAGYWTITGCKVELSKAEKREIGRSSSPRWEIDVVAYKGRTNELLAVECKSYLDSRGVVFRDKHFDPDDRYKLFTDANLRRVVLQRLGAQMIKSGFCRPKPRVTLALATGKIASVTDRAALESHFKHQGWQLFDDDWIRETMTAEANSDYEDNVALVVAKVLLRNHKRPSSLPIEQAGPAQASAKARRKR